jgi:hypothetical protein
MLEMGTHLKNTSCNKKRPRDSKLEGKGNKRRSNKKRVLRQPTTMNNTGEEKCKELVGTTNEDTKFKGGGGYTKKPLSYPVVYLRKEKIATTPSKLYNLFQETIVTDGITYKCSNHIREENTIITKKYGCAMVQKKEDNPKGERHSRPSYRQNKKMGADFIPCRGMMKGTFTKANFWFQNTQVHICGVRHAGDPRSIDNRPPLLNITAAPNWGIGNKEIEDMKNALESCSEDWWEGLPNQGTSRKYLKAIDNTHLYPNAEGLRVRVETVMKPFLEYLAKQYPLLRFRKVGALRTAPNAMSQYEKCGNKLHSDYTEKVLKQPVEERPWSMIMALDDFEFFCKLESTETEEYQTTTVKRKQAIAFTNELFHAGGPNKTDKYVYRLFAYITSNAADYPPGTVFTLTTANTTRLAEAKKDNLESSFVRVSGRNTNKPDFYK